MQFFLEKKKRFILTERTKFFLATPPPQSNKIIYSGYLTKEGGSITTWKKRYFELTPTEMRYYERLKKIKTSFEKNKINFFNLLFIDRS